MCRLRYIGIFNEIFDAVEDEIHPLAVEANFINRVDFIHPQGWISLLCYNSKSCTFEIVAEQKARAMYDAILRMTDDPDVADVIKFLRQREVVHFQRFGEAMEILKNKKF